MIEDAPKPSPSSSIYEDAQEHHEHALADDLLTHNDADENQTRGNTLLITKDLPSTPSKGLHASPVSDVGPGGTGSATVLTPLRAHYLKKSLVTLQFSKELLGFTDLDPAWPTLSPLSYLGAPFTPPPKGAPPLQVPFLRFMFRQFVLSFPFIASAPRDFFPAKLQPFIGSLVSRNLSTTDDILGMDEPDYDPETRSRQKLVAKTEKYFSLVLGSALKLTEPEEVVRLSQRDLDRLEVLARRRAAKAQRARDGFDVNIICVRTVVEKGRVRSRVHEEFVIRTRRAGFKDVLVSRRYGDFKTLADELRKAYPDFEIKGPPPKDRTVVALAAQNQPPSSFNPPQPVQRTNTAASSSEDLSAKPSSASVDASMLAREKNRVTLRSYLHGLLASSVIVNSPVIKSFLLSGPTTLTPEEEEDSRHREDADHLREEGRKRFAKEVANRVDGLRNAVRSVKSDMMGKNGLVNLFAAVKATPIAKDLPPNYRAVLEWGRITLASTIFQNFIAADDASGTLTALKRFHGLMPYFMLKGILRVSNPMAMIRGVMDLFMAQPFGGKSLLQRMFTSSLSEESKALQEDIAAVSEKVNDPAMCEKVRQFIYGPKEIQTIYREDAAAEKINLLLAILRSNEQPLLNRAQMARVIRAAKAHREYMDYRETLNDSDDDDGPENDDAWLFEDLNILAKLYSRLRDKEQLIDLIFEGTTSDLLRDMFAIFYAPLAQVYKAASIADSLGDLQNFITDLIRTIEYCETMSNGDPQQTVQLLISLVERHEQAFYSFVHKVQTKGEGLFDSLMHWIELFLTLTRDGFGQETSLEFILPHIGQEREQIMKEVDDVALYYYKMKLIYEEKLRRRFGRAHAGNGADADDAAAQELVDGVVKELSFGELVKGDATDIAAQESSDSDDDDDSDSSEEEEDSSSDEDEDADTAGQPTPKPSRPVSAAPETRQPRSPQKPSSPTHANAPRAQSRPNDFRNRPMYQPQAPMVLPDAASPAPPRPRLRPSKSFSGPSTPSVSKDDIPPMPRSAIPPGSTPSHNRKNPSEDNSRTQTPTRRPPPQADKRKRKKGAAAALEPPKLVFIPKLLPLFLEIISPLLKPQRVE
ncbi:hypothetical protein M408DRAFT_331345 [Serendipita vermifera MAFF 305830]|uniref:PX domain-containing protein n=1 Tax=Serendipita vermifera MAFF 305830 TaxID=933852 RepID=A0A0C3AZ59_SERVB|nr:hypothetical protein M408DRAFT_331345 [Serendipita vermifera MAFF 305830]